MCRDSGLIEQHKLIAEGAGAVSVAAAMFNKVPVKVQDRLCSERRKYRRDDIEPRDQPRAFQKRADIHLLRGTGR